MSSIEYGSFLSREARARARYEFYKPALSLGATCFTLFMVTGLLVTGFGWWLETMSIPQKNYSVTNFVKAQQVDKELREGLALLQNTRPQNVDVCRIVQRLSTRPKGVELTDISLKPELYTVKGTSVNSNLLKEYLLSLNDQQHKAMLKDIRDKDNNMHFTVVVTQQKGGKGK